MSRNGHVPGALAPLAEETAPQNLDAEEYVLGAMMLAPAAADKTRRLLSRRDFYRESHAAIFEALLVLRERGEPTEPVFVIAELERRGKLEKAGGTSRVHEIAVAATAHSNAPHYARLIVDAARKRDLFSVAGELRTATQNGGPTPELLERTVRAALRAAPSAHGARVRTFEELLDQYVEERTNADAEPIRLGFGSIDADIRGVSAGQVLGVAARTAVGKTWVLNSILRTFSARRDAAALALSLELPGAEWAERQVAVHKDVEPEQVERWAREGVLKDQARDFLERMHNVFVADDPVALAEIPSVLDDARARATAPLRLVAIDYLGLLGADGKDAYERASAIGKGLKLTAKREQVAVVVAAQLSRAGGDGSEPVSIDMLRDSGVIEESLDFLLGAWRPERAKNLSPVESEELRDVLRVAVLKNRKGSDGRVVDLRFHRNSRRVYEETTFA